MMSRSYRAMLREVWRHPAGILRAVCHACCVQAAPVSLVPRLAGQLLQPPGRPQRAVVLPVHHSQWLPTPARRAGEKNDIVHVMMYVDSLTNDMHLPKP